MDGLGGNEFVGVYGNNRPTKVEVSVNGRPAIPVVEDGKLIFHRTDRVEGSKPPNLLRRTIDKILGR